MLSEIYGYGESERIIGRLLAKTDEETRKKIYLATKCECGHALPQGWTDPTSTQEWVPWPGSCAESWA